MLMILLVADQTLRHVNTSVLGDGLLDEPAHLLAGVLLLAAVPRLRNPVFVIGVLCGSVLIDLDHIPAILGHDFLTEGTQRPYSHSLLTLIVLGAIAAAWRRHRALFLGLLVGVAYHFWRDMSEVAAAGVSLLWPWSDHSYMLPHWTFLTTVAISIHRRRRARHPARAHPSGPGIAGNGPSRAAQPISGRPGGGYV